MELVSLIITPVKANNFEIKLYVSPHLFSPLSDAETKSSIWQNERRLFLIASQARQVNGRIDIHSFSLDE